MNHRVVKRGTIILDARESSGVECSLSVWKQLVSHVVLLPSYSEDGGMDHKSLNTWASLEQTEQVIANRPAS